MTPRARPTDALDLHVVAIALVALLPAALLPFGWLPWLVALLPSGRLVTRAQDLRRAGRPRRAHLLVNGGVVIAATAAAFALSPAR